MKRRFEVALSSVGVLPLFVKYVFDKQRQIRLAGQTLVSECFHFV
jgi:hypothetical protein